MGESLCSTVGILKLLHHLTELDGTMLKLKFAAFCIVPYHTHSSKSILVMQFVDPTNLAGVEVKDD